MISAIDTFKGLLLSNIQVENVNTGKVLVKGKLQLVTRRGYNITLYITTKKKTKTRQYILPFPFEYKVEHNRIVFFYQPEKFLDEQSLKLFNLKFRTNTNSTQKYKLLNQTIAIRKV